MSLWMRRALLIGALVGLAAFAAVSAQAFKPKRLLIVTVTKGYRHADSIEVGEKILADLGAKSKSFTVDYVRNDEEMAQKMTAEGLKRYDAVFFLNTTGDLPLPDREAFLLWIAQGHGFIGVHSATDTFHGYGPYLDMIGGEFKTHGAQSEVTCRVANKNHPATKMLGDSFKVYDEIYQLQRYDRTRFQELIVLDNHPNDGTPGYYPIAWYRTPGKGRVFYSALGHRIDVWESAWFQAHLLGGIRWALGLEKNPTR